MKHKTRRYTYEVEVSVRQRIQPGNRKDPGGLVGKSGRGKVLIRAEVGQHLGLKQREAIAEQIELAARRIVEDHLR